MHFKDLPQILTKVHVEQYVSCILRTLPQILTILLEWYVCRTLWTLASNLDKSIAKYRCIYMHFKDMPQISTKVYVEQYVSCILRTIPQILTKL